MNICLLFHCLCESYEHLPQHGQELFASITDVHTMIEDLSRRGYKFGTMDDSTSQTVSITFDDGYHNNLLFDPLAHFYGIPYVIFTSAYYNLTGDPYPWFYTNGLGYSDVHSFNFYDQYQEIRQVQNGTPTDELIRPLTLAELDNLRKSSLAEVGCHGYYHQPLSRSYEKYLHQELEQALGCLKEALNIRPRYFSLANGMYTKWVMRQLLNTFERVFTIEGRPYHQNDRTIHRITLLNPNIAGPLIQQIDRHLKTVRQVRRTIRSFVRSIG